VGALTLNGVTLNSLHSVFSGLTFGMGIAICCALRERTETIRYASWEEEEMVDSESDELVAIGAGS
jgi:hypothetical protein